MLSFYPLEKWLKVLRWCNMNHNLQLLFVLVIDLPSSYILFNHPQESLMLLCTRGIAEVPCAAMDLEKPSVWGSLKQRTRPFLQNLSVRKTKKRSSKMVVSKIRSLDRRLSVSVPDMLEVETLTEEETTYSSTQMLSSGYPRGAPRPMVSLKRRNSSMRPEGEDWPWLQASAACTEPAVAHLDAPMAGSPVSEGKRPSSDDFLELLQKAHLSTELANEMMEVRGWELATLSSHRGAYLSGL